MDENAKATTEARRIVARLRKEIQRYGYRENLGNSEWIAFSDYLDRTRLSYSDKASLLGMLQSEIDAL